MWVVFLLLHVPALVANLRLGLGATFETLAVCGAAWLLAGLLPPEPRLPQKWNAALDGMARKGALGYAISLPVFGLTDQPVSRPSLENHSSGACAGAGNGGLPPPLRSGRVPSSGSPISRRTAT